MKSGSGKLVSESAIKKCPGVKAERSFISDEIGVSGLEFKIDSISTESV